MNNIKKVLGMVLGLMSIAPLCASQEPAKKRKDRDEHAAAAAASSSSSASAASASLAGQSAPEAQDSQGQASSSDESATKKHKNESGQSVAIITKDEFIAAIKAEDKEKVDAYLNKNQDVDWVDQQGKTPLIHACDGNCLPIFQSILAHTQNVEMESINGATALLCAANNAGNNSVEYIKQLLARGARLDVKSKGGWNALMYAAKGNKSGVVFLLDEKKVPVDEQDARGRTALFQAMASMIFATTEQQKEAAKQIAEFLLKHGANIEHRDQFDYSIFHLAVVQAMSIDAITFLLDHGADIDGQRVAVSPNSKKITPLLSAIEERNARTVHSNINSPADREHMQRINDENRKKLLDIIRLLVNRGASLDLFVIVPGQNSCALMLAARWGDFEVTKFLVMPPVSAPNGIRNSQGETAYDCAYKGFVIEKDMAKKEQRRLIMQFLSNPFDVARLDKAEEKFAELNALRRISFEQDRKDNKNAKYEGDLMPKDLFNMMSQYLLGPEEKYRVLHEIVGHIRLNKVRELRNVFVQHPDSLVQTNEGGDTPLIVAVKCHQPNALVSVIQGLKNYRVQQLRKHDADIKKTLDQDPYLKECDARYQAELGAEKDSAGKELYEKYKGKELKQKRDEDFKRKFEKAKNDYRQKFDTEFDLDSQFEQAKKIAHELGYQDVINVLQEYSPNESIESMDMRDHSSSSSSSAASAAAASSFNNPAAPAASAHDVYDMEIDN